MKEKVKELLLSVKRVGMEDFVDKLEKTDFFVAPASTRYHLCCEGGLIQHSFSVYELFKKKLEEFKLDLSEESIIIISILHDACKIGAYKKNEKGKYFWNKNQPKGHASLSIKRIKHFIDLTPIEEEIITWHMGFYGCSEFTEKGEYTISELVAAYNKNKLAKLFYFCDDMSSQFLEERDV